MSTSVRFMNGCFLRPEHVDICGCSGLIHMPEAARTDFYQLMRVDNVNPCTLCKYWLADDKNFVNIKLSTFFVLLKNIYFTFWSGI